MPAKIETKEATAEAQLKAYIDKLDPKIQTLMRSVRTAVRKRFPTANELAYDYTDNLVISYSPSDRGIEAVVAISARPTGVFLYFNQGQVLPDPKGMLQGSGKQTRFIQLNAAKQLADPDVEALIAATVTQAKVPLPLEGKGSLTIKSSAAKKRAKQAAAK